MLAACATQAPVICTVANTKHEKRTTVGDLEFFQYVFNLILKLQK